MPWPAGERATQVGVERAWQKTISPVFRELGSVNWMARICGP